MDQLAFSDLIDAFIGPFRINFCFEAIQGSIFETQVYSLFRYFESPILNFHVLGSTCCLVMLIHIPVSNLGIEHNKSVTFDVLELVRDLEISI